MNWVIQPAMIKPPPDPFDHSHCWHPRPRWILNLSPSFRVDLFEVLHHLWKLLLYGNTPAAIALIEQLNSYLIRSALGMQDEIDAQVAGQDQLRTDLQTLSNDKAFNDELRKLFEEDQNGTDGPGESPAL